jgi:hypothetical protein
MSETRKVNWRNVSIVMLVGVLGTVVGFVDRIINQVRPLEDVYLFLSTTIPLTHDTAVGATEWYNSSATMSMTMSSFNMPITIIAIVLMVMVIAMLSRTMCYAA